jgi:homoserine kinase type II
MAIVTLVSEEELSSIVEAYGLPSIARARGIPAGTVNTSYALELVTAERYFLRIYEEQDLNGASREAAVLAHLASQGVRTPAPIVARDGATTRVVAGKPAAIFPWVDGDMLCQRSVTPAVAFTVGAALARIHLAGHAPAARLDGGRFQPEQLIARCARVANSSDAEARRLSGELAEAMRSVSERRYHAAPRGLIHGDLFRDNVLWTHGSESAARDIAALLDFESAHDGPFAYDLAVTLLSWCFGDGFDVALARTMVSGYRSVRELEEGDVRALFDEAIFASLRFTITRITDDAIRVGKRWQRFMERRDALERLGREGFLSALGAVTQ